MANVTMVENRAETFMEVGHLVSVVRLVMPLNRNNVFNVECYLAL